MNRKPLHIVYFRSLGGFRDYVLNISMSSDCLCLLNRHTEKNVNVFTNRILKDTLPLPMLGMDAYLDTYLSPIAFSYV